MSNFWWFRKWRGGYWIYSYPFKYAVFQYSKRWMKVTKGRYDAYNMCSVLYGGINEKEDWSKIGE